jgi:hypothetical protein
VALLLGELDEFFDLFAEGRAEIAARGIAAVIEARRRD